MDTTKVVPGLSLLGLLTFRVFFYCKKRGYIVKLIKVRRRQSGVVLYFNRFDQRSTLVTLTEVKAYDSMRPQGLRKKGKTSKSKHQFVPTEAQIIRAMGRIEGMLKKYHGAFTCLASKERVHRELVGEIHSHGSQLGRGPDEICETIRLALVRLTDEGKVRFEENAEGHLYLILKLWRHGRAHKDKYRQQRPGKRNRFRAAA
ncbi:MAG: hypothetical protein JWO99_654 [Candidatus Saccharibacteria bacterium]|nr:hypothetical protein [Candidatus Saccharibacteria bacterium]